eukprot:gene5548-9367_t
MMRLNDDHESDEEVKPTNKKVETIKKIAQVALIFVCIASILIFVPTIILIDYLQGLPPNDAHSLAEIILRDTPIIDGHNDLPDYVRSLQRNNVKYDLRREPTAEEDKKFSEINGFALQTTIPRLREGRLGSQFWSAWVSCKEKEPLKRTLEQIGIIEELINQHPDTFVFAKSTDDIMDAHSKQLISSLIGIEGGHCIEDSLLALKGFYNAGARYMTLTHTCNTAWCDSANGPERFGLNAFGKQVIELMNDLGMMVDISHVSPKVMNMTLDISRSPVIFSHSGVYSLCKHFRNVPDFIIKRLKFLDGVIMIPFYPVFVSETERLVNAEFNKLNLTGREVSAKFRKWQIDNPHLRGNISTIVDHIDYIKKLNGDVKNIGLGSDFDGIPYLLKGAETVRAYYPIVLELIKRKYTKDEIEMIIGRNLLRVMKRNEELKK